jgi:hypothetical protein
MKTIEEYEDELCHDDNTWQVKRKVQAARVLHFYASEITKYHELGGEKTIDITPHEIGLNSVNRKDVIAFLQAFGGDWKREADSFYEGALMYTREVPHPFIKPILDGEGEVDYQPMFVIQVRNAPPPPSCKLVEEIVEVPATTIKVKKVVCAEKDINLEPEPA